MRNFLLQFVLVTLATMYFLSSWFTLTALVIVSTLFGLFVATGDVAAKYYLLSRKYRQALEFVRYKLDLTAPVRDGAETKLHEYAREVRDAAELQMSLQQLGHQAFHRRHSDYVYRRHETYEEASERLRRNFQGYQENFYSLYDEALKVKDVLHLTLKKRDWKVYAGEPQLPKEEAS